MSEETEPQPPQTGTRDLVLYVQVGVAMIPLVFLFTGLCAGVDYLLVLLQDHALADQVQKAAEAHRDTAQFVPEMMKLLAPRMHWSMVALVASLLTFPVLGWILGRYARDPGWAGILPLVDLASGFSPVLMGSPDMPQLIAVPEQVGILVVQIVTVHWTAHRAWASRNAAE